MTPTRKEEQEYVDSIRDAVKWLGYETCLADSPVAPGTLQPHEYFASDYFDFMYRAAEYLIIAGLAYVDEQTPEQMRAARGDFNTPGMTARSVPAAPTRTWRASARCETASS
jgi:glutaminyl-tRNA synthetase